MILYIIYFRFELVTILIEINTRPIKAIFTTTQNHVGILLNTSFDFGISSGS